MKKIVVIMFLVLAFSVGMVLAEDPSNPKPKKVKECVEWTPVKVPIKYVCGTKWVGNIQQDVWCTKYEETVKCTKWADVEGWYHPECKDTLLASENCVCAECGRKCGSGHDPSCSSYRPKAKEGIDDLFAQSVNPNDLKKSDPKTPSLKNNPPPAPTEPPKKEPTIIDNIKKGIQKRFDPPEHRGPAVGPPRA